MAPRLRVRDEAALRTQFPGKSADEIADALIEGAARAAAAAGGATGMAAALPVLPAFPVEIAAETLVLVGIELKLVAELHEAYGSPAPGKFPERMSAYVASWAHRRGVFMIEGGLIFAAGSPLARLLRRRLAARAGRSAFSLGPMLTGAAAGALFNRRETRKLGREIQRDLRRRSIERAREPAVALVTHLALSSGRPRRSSRRAAPPGHRGTRAGRGSTASTVVRSAYSSGPCWPEPSTPNATAAMPSWP